MSTRRAHFVPQTYLREFSYDRKKEKVHAFSNMTGDVRPWSIESICHQSFLYRVEDANGQPSDEIEDYFANEIEPLYGKWLDKIRLQKPLDNSMIADLAHYVALQHLRIPESLERTEEMGKEVFKETTNEQWAKLLDDNTREKVMKELEEQHPDEFAELRKKFPDTDFKLSKQDIQSIMDEANGFSVEIDIGWNNIIKNMLETIPFVAEQIVASGWNFIFAPEGKEFITTDMPCYVMIPMQRGAVSFRQGGFGRKGAHVVFPLAKDICLIIQQGDYYQKFGVGKPASVDKTNLITSQHYNRYVVGYSSAVVEVYSPKS